jgi:hypothetical protein
VLVCPRIQFARTAHGNLRGLGFVLYNDVADVKQHDRIIIQYESLHLLRGVEAFDLVVLDEIESILENMTSEPTNKTRLKANAAIFQGLVSGSRVVALDADLSNKTLQYLKSVVGAEQITLHINEHRALHRDVLVYPRRSGWVDAIKSALSAGQRLLIVTGSKRAADNHILPLLQAMADPFKFKYYHADCDDDLLDDFECIEEAWTELDVAVITPRVTVGADFSTPQHFDAIFAYGEPSSVVPRTLLQMCGRCRNPKNPTIHTFVNQKHRGVRPTLDSVRRDVIDRANVLEGIEAGIFDFNPDYSTGRLELTTAPRPMSEVYLHNRTEKKRAEANYTAELEDIAAAKGYTVVHLDADDKEDNANDKTYEMQVTRIFDATPSIDDDEAERLKTNQERGRASEADKWKLKKYTYEGMFPDADVDGEHYVTLQKHVATIVQICLTVRVLVIKDAYCYDMRRFGHAYRELVSDQLMYPKLFLMQKVAKLIHLNRILDTDTEVSSTHLKNIGPALARLDTGPIFGVSLAAESNFKQILGFLNQLFRKWCGATFKKHSTERPRKGKLRPRLFLYKLTFPEVLLDQTLLDIAETTRFFKCGAPPTEKARVPPDRLI